MNDTDPERAAFLKAEAAQVLARVREEMKYNLTALDAAQKFDTPAAHRLLEALVAAQEAAEAVDRERGHYVDFEPQIEGESKGTDYAESVSELAFRLRREIAPPKGRGE